MASTPIHGSNSGPPNTAAKMSRGSTCAEHGRARARRAPRSAQGGAWSAALPAAASPRMRACGGVGTRIGNGSARDIDSGSGSGVRSTAACPPCPPCRTSRGSPRRRAPGTPRSAPAPRRAGTAAGGKGGKGAARRQAKQRSGDRSSTRRLMAGAVHGELRAVSSRDPSGTIAQCFSGRRHTGRRSSGRPWFANGRPWVRRGKAP